MDDEHGGMVDMYGGMVDYGGVNVVEIESRLGMVVTKPTIRWGPKSRTGTSQVIRNKKRKTKFGQDGLIGEDIKKISSYFLLEGSKSQGR